MLTSLKQYCNQQHGVSAPESLIVVAIIGIIATFTIPNITRTIDLRQLDTYGSVVAGKMTEARTYAIKHNRTAWFRIDPINRTTQIQTTDNLGNTINLKASELIPSRIQMAETTPVEFRFDSMGRLTTGSETVTLQMSSSGDTKSKAITGFPAGKIRVGSMY